MKYLVAEIFPEHYRIVIFEYGHSGRQIIAEQVVFFENLSRLKDFICNPKNSGYPAIVSLSSKLASTDFVCQRFRRQSPERLIDEAELEGLVTRLIRDNIPADQLLIRSFTIDGHKTPDPIGLAGTEISIYFSRTRIDKDIKDELKSIFLSGRVILAGDAGAFFTHIISQTRPKNGPFILAAIYYDFSSLFICGGGRAQEFQKISWGEKNLLSVLFGRLALEQNMARKVLNAYCAGRMSSNFYGKLSGLFGQEFQKLSDQIRQAARERNVNSVCAVPFFDIPFQGLKLGGIKLSIVDNDFISNRLGFELKLKSVESERILFSAAALLAEADTISLDGLANRIADRRLRWSQNLKKQ